MPNTFVELFRLYLELTCKNIFILSEDHQNSKTALNKLKLREENFQQLRNI